jgi:transposase
LLHSLALAAPEWLRVVSPPEWKNRYARRAEDDRLPTTHAARAALTRAIGSDGWRLLASADDPDAPLWLREVPAVGILRRVWMQHDWWGGTRLHWREADNIPPAAQFISSPSDAEAHYARKHTTQWVGYKVHLTESCEDDLPQLITNVDTTIGPASDGAATPRIHAALQQRDLLPGTPIVDTGYLDAALLVESREHYGVDLLGPMRLDYHWQARQGAGFDAQHFQVDGDQQQATCPAGKTSTGWTPAVDNRGNPGIKVTCATKDCRRCDQIAHCIRSTTRDPRRPLSIRPQPQYQALQAARQREATGAFQSAYARRAGIEGPIARGMRSTRLRRTRYMGPARVHLGHLLTAVGLNVLRLSDWWLESARAKTRLTPFARLLAAATAA